MIKNVIFEQVLKRYVFNYENDYFQSSILPSIIIIIWNNLQPPIILTPPPQLNLLVDYKQQNQVSSIYFQNLIAFFVMDFTCILVSKVTIYEIVYRLLTAQKKVRS